MCARDNNGCLEKVAGLPVTRATNSHRPRRLRGYRLRAVRGGTGTRRPPAINVFLTHPRTWIRGCAYTRVGADMYRIQGGWNSLPVENYSSP